MTSSEPGVPPSVLAARRRSECLVPEADVRFAIDQLAVRMLVTLAETNPLVICVMNGGLLFTSELMQRWDFPLELAYLHVGRYRDRTRGGELQWHVEPAVAVAGRHVLLVDDVLDEGATLAALVRWGEAAGARSVRTAVLVDKARAGDRPVVADYAALRCPDRYLFGCGMDYQGYWRNLPAIYALPEDLERPGPQRVED